MINRLTNKVALVTGAGSGIGRATALRLAAEGARVIAMDVNEFGAAATVAAVLAENGHAIPVTCDVSDAAQVPQAIERAVAGWGKLDILFNAAGASGRRWGDGPVDECTVEGWQRTLSVNLDSVFLVCKYAVPYLLESESGSVINLASVLGMVGGDADFGTHAYAASKAGIIGLSRAMASYYAPRGLRVNVVAPGLIETPMSRRAQSNPHILTRLTQLQPLTGGMGQPEDIAGAVAYLASDDARFVTGVVLPVDGGWTAQ